MTDTDAFIEAWEYVGRLRSAANAVADGIPDRVRHSSSQFADRLERLEDLLRTPPPHRPPPSPPTDPQQPTTRWQATVVTVYSSHNVSDAVRLDQHLDDGWEPFAVTSTPDGWDYHLRRPHR